MGSERLFSIIHLAVERVFRRSVYLPLLILFVTAIFCVHHFPITTPRLWEDTEYHRSALSFYDHVMPRLAAPALFGYLALGLHWLTGVPHVVLYPLLAALSLLAATLLLYRRGREAHGLDPEMAVFPAIWLVMLPAGATAFAQADYPFAVACALALVTLEADRLRSPWLATGALVAGLLLSRAFVPFAALVLAGWAPVPSRPGEPRLAGFWIGAVALALAAWGHLVSSGYGFYFLGAQTWPALAKGAGILSALWIGFFVAARRIPETDRLVMMLTLPLAILLDADWDRAAFILIFPAALPAIAAFLQERLPSPGSPLFLAIPLLLTFLLEFDAGYPQAEGAAAFPIWRYLAAVAVLAATSPRLRGAGLTGSER